MSAPVPPRRISFQFEGSHDELAGKTKLTVFIAGNPDAFQSLIERLSRLAKAGRADNPDGEWRESLKSQLMKINANGDEVFHSPRLVHTTLVLHADGHARLDVDVELPNGASLHNTAWKGSLAALRTKLGVESPSLAPAF